MIPASVRWGEMVWGSNLYSVYIAWSAETYLCRRKRPITRRRICGVDWAMVFLRENCKRSICKAFFRSLEESSSERRANLYNIFLGLSVLSLHACLIFV